MFQISMFLVVSILNVILDVFVIIGGQIGKLVTGLTVVDFIGIALVCIFVLFRLKQIFVYFRYVIYMIHVILVVVR